MKLRWAAAAAPQPAATPICPGSAALTTSSSSTAQHPASIWDWPAAPPAAAAAAGDPPRHSGRSRLLPALPHAELSVALDATAVRFSAAHSDRVLVVEQPPHAQHARRRHGEPAARSSAGAPGLAPCTHAHVPGQLAHACETSQDI
jgi:hypothetical protein